jgi:ribose transport system permease protein
MARNAIIAAGMTLVVLTGGIDLSVGSVLALTSVLAALMAKGDFVPLPLALAGGVACGGLLGAANGALIALARLPPFVVTLAAMVMARSAVQVLTDNVSIYDLPRSLDALGRGRVGPVPVPLLLTGVLYAAVYLLLRHYRFGRAVYAIGGNKEAARLSGIRTRWVKIQVYAAAGALAALAGLVEISRAGAADPKSGVMYELDAIAAVVVGGASLSGGRGGIGGTFLGALFIAILANALQLLGISSDYQGLVTGAVILAAVLAGRFRGGG